MKTSNSSFHFAAFSLYPASRLLLEDGQPVRIGARALDLLIALTERAGEVVSKEELFRLVWPNTIVEETSLRVHVAALRKLLGGPDARYIANVPGKGYTFTAELDRKGNDIPPSQPLVARGLRHKLPVRLTRMIGRLGSAERVASALLTQRFVTITGEGGVGKTTLALSVAEASQDDYADGIAFVDLAVISSASQVVSTVGRAIGLALPAGTPVNVLAEALKGQRFLLVIDNCEHLLACAADLITELLRSVASLRVLATSREPLRAAGEQVHRLDTLATPPSSQGLISASEALRFDAVQLLVERVAASTDGFALSDEDAPCAAELCRRLDGIPLAIELAAARVGFFGLRGLLARLPDRLQILTSGHRTVMPRHQTLRALFDWSYDLLQQDARLAFARLGVFPGAFSLEGALAMMPTSDRSAALATFLDLMSKSLVAADLGDQTRMYRLLDTARVYALDRLAASGTGADCRLAHAAYLVRTLEAVNPEWSRPSREAWLARHGYLLEDIGAALAWLASGEIDPLLYGQLTAVSFQLSQQLSQLELHRGHLRQALVQLRTLPMRHAKLELQLNAALGQSLSQSQSTLQTVDAWVSGLEDEFGQLISEPALLYAMAVAWLAHGEYRRMLKCAERLELMAEGLGERPLIIVGRRMQAQARHFVGDIAAGRRLAEDVLKYPSGRHPGGIVDAMDRRLSMGIILARSHWLEGDSEEAARLNTTVSELARQEIEHAQCQVLGLATIPIALWDGDMALARQRLDVLARLVTRPALADYWGPWAEALTEVAEGRPVTGPIEGDKLADLVGTLCPSFTDARLLARALAGTAGWNAAEVMRRHAERLLVQSPDEAGDATELLLRALKLAREQGATRWELRAATSLARLSARTGQRLVDEQAVMGPLARLNGAVNTPDAVAAHEALRMLTLRITGVSRL